MIQRYRFLLSPRWLGWFAVCIVFFVVCTFLGQWQIDRREQALEEINRISDNYDEQAISYADARDLVAAGDIADEWTVVQAQGRYLDDSVFVRNRGHQGSVGYEQVVPFQEASTGDIIMVSRGWLPTSSTDGGQPASNPAPPSGTVNLVARIRPAEPDIARGAPEGQVASIEPGAVEAETGVDVVDGSYAVMASESPQPEETPQALGRPAMDEGPHLSYSMQWIAFGLLGFVGLGYSARLHARSLDLEQLESTDDEQMAPANPIQRQYRMRQAQRIQRHKAGRYSDEDAEDAWVEGHLPSERS